MQAKLGRSVELFHFGSMVLNLVATIVLNTNSYTSILIFRLGFCSVASRKFFNTFGAMFHTVQFLYVHTLNFLLGFLSTTTEVSIAWIDFCIHLVNVISHL